jgi:hypothetical protein
MGLMPNSGGIVGLYQLAFSLPSINCLAAQNLGMRDAGVLHLRSWREGTNPVQIIITNDCGLLRDCNRP